MRARTLLVLLGSAAALLLLWRPGQGPARTEVGVTGELGGRWVTTAPRHAGRFLAIGPDRVTFGQGEAGEESHRLAAVYLEASETGPQAYVLVYELPGDATADASVELRVRVSNGRLRIEHLPDVEWTREP